MSKLHFDFKDKECSNVRTIIETKVNDDGWILPKYMKEEIISEIVIKVTKAKDSALKAVIKAHNAHKGKWITKEIAYKYYREAYLFRTIHQGQYVGRLRKMGEELIKKYGVTEMEAINILNGYHIGLYAEKYYRMQYMIPNGVSVERITTDIVRKYYA